MKLPVLAKKDMRGHFPNVCCTAVAPLASVGMRLACSRSSIGSWARSSVLDVQDRVYANKDWLENDAQRIAELADGDVLGDDIHGLNDL